MSRINGVEYFGVGHEDFTVRYDLYMHSKLQLTGVASCLASKGSDRDLIQVLESSPHTPKLLAGLIKCKPDQWDPIVALATEALITTCTRVNDKIMLFEMLVSGLNAFFATRQSILDDFPSIVLTGVTGHLTEREPPETRGFKQYGQWDEPLRVLAGYNPDIVAKELDWHLRDFLLAYEYHVKQRAAESYRDAAKIYATLAPYAKKGKLKPPKLPRILRGRRSHGINQE